MALGIGPSGAEQSSAQGATLGEPASHLRRRTAPKRRENLRAPSLDGRLLFHHEGHEEHEEVVFSFISFVFFVVKFGGRTILSPRCNLGRTGDPERSLLFSAFPRLIWFPLQVCIPHPFTHWKHYEDAPPVSGSSETTVLFAPFRRIAPPSARRLADVATASDRPLPARGRRRRRVW